MIEVRAAVEMRAADGRTLIGRAAVWDRPTRIGGPGGFMEVVRRGAFAAHLATGADVFLLAHHDFGQPLARRGNSSLKLQEDATGLSFEATLPQTRAADDILELAAGLPLSPPRIPGSTISRTRSPSICQPWSLASLRWGRAAWHQPE